MDLLDQLLLTNQSFLLGSWLKFVQPWASSPGERKQLNYDARSILTTWGDRKASEAGLHEYANRDWAGLTSGYYKLRWKLYFDSLLTSLDTKTPPKPIDWYAFGDAWNRKSTTYTAVPVGQSYPVAMKIAQDLNLAP
jgi:alpha-N-acetylglucosaminidase